MSVPMLTKMHMNGYDVLSVNNGPWRVCTKGDRLGAFGSKEEALAFAAALPGYKARASRCALLHSAQVMKLLWSTLPLPSKLTLYVC